MAAVVLFDADGNWQDTLVCEQRVAAALDGIGASHGRGDAAGAVPAGLRVLEPAGDAGVFYLPRTGGWVGVLCEAGEWVAVPAAAATFEAGGEPPGLGPLLPAREEFIERLLSLLGEDAADDR